MKCEKCWGTGEVIDQKRLGRLMRELREARGESLKDAAQRIGVSISFLCLMEQGKRGWSQDKYESFVNGGPK